MEAGYVDHKAASQHSSLSTSGLVNHDNTLSISMTATMDTMGNLVLGKLYYIIILFSPLSGLRVLSNFFLSFSFPMSETKIFL